MKIKPGTTDWEGQRLPQQGDVDNYLYAVPRQAASVTGFTNFFKSPTCHHTGP